MVLLLSIVPFAAQARDGRFDLPTVYIRGNGQDIYDEDGTLVYDFDVSTDQIKDIAKAVLPLLLKGYITNDFTEYYVAFGSEMSKIYDRCQMDENGDPKYGTDISAQLKADNERLMHTDLADANGQYTEAGYNFNSDWRRDPMEVVDDLAVYIDTILETTGAQKVNLLCTCLGGDLVLAYLSKYGTEKLHGIGFQQTVAFGAELVDETFSGRIKLDPDAIERFAYDNFLRKTLNMSNETLYAFLQESIALARASDVLKGATDLFMKTLYNRLYEGLVPELALATYGTWPGYWTMVTAEHYASTREFIFGQPGSERYEKYAGLIEKLDRYDAAVRQQIPALLSAARDAGHPVALTVYYGDQMPPVLESADEQGDVWTTVRYASLGATVSKIGTTLSDDYIAQRTAAGYGAYISPDRQIDASTCMFPDTTWFIKGAIHNDLGTRNDVTYSRVFNAGATVATNPDRPQYLVFDPETHIVSPMTEENMNVETYPVSNEKPSFFDNVRAFFKHLGEWFRLLFALMKKD